MSSTKIITDEELGYALYSINKYAKENRDIKNNWNSTFQDKIRAEDEMLILYDLKEAVLKNFQPKQLHIQSIGVNNKPRVYEFEDRFENINDTIKIETGRFLGEEYYVNYKISQPCEHYIYFLYYEIGSFKFHLPIPKPMAYKYKDERGVTYTKKLPDNFYMPFNGYNGLMDKSDSIEIINSYLNNCKYDV